jgi:hypothetical protein
MGSLSIASLIAISAFVGTVTVDVTINALQNWYDTVYADAFWSSRASDTPALRDLAKEEAEINRLLSQSGFENKRVVLVDQAPPPAARAR